MLEDILDGLFHIAKADGVMHEREGIFLRRIAEIFRIDEAHYERIVARHVDLGDGRPLRRARRRARLLARRSPPHYRRSWSPTTIPDRLIARGVPQEFIAIATTRLAAINAAYEMIERGAADAHDGFPADQPRRRHQGLAEFRAERATGRGPT